MKKISLLFSAILFITSAHSQKHLISNSSKITGEGGWDYLAVDTINQKLFVSHSNVVNVLDLKSNQLIATIPNTKGVHGIAIANELNKAFTSNGKDNSVSVVDLKTFQLIEKIAIEGINPDAILYDVFSNHVFVFNGKSNDATVIDATSNKVVGTIALGGKPEFSVTNNKGLVYVNIEDTNQIKTINTTSLKVTSSWDISPGEEPTGLAIDLQSNTLFSVCSNQMMVIVDATKGKIIATVPIGDGCDGVVFDSKNKVAFSSNGDGTITVVKETKQHQFAVLETIKTKEGARTIAINPITQALYLPTASFGVKPEATTANPHPRAPIIPNSFEVFSVTAVH
jgi:YVTN family beta-propeller protein